MPDLSIPSALKRPPQSILFVCSENSVRSPMAEALTRKIIGNTVYVASVGLRRGKIDSFAAEVLREIGIEGGLRAPRAFEDFEDEAFDLVVSLTPEARDRIAELARGVPTELAYWPTPDPTQVEGTRETVLNAYRAARDGLARRIRELFMTSGAP
ncbi:protein-tyrosine-phosphatase [Methylovirgula ligni]|uniref:Protein-tyrosine-phosphatase n=1 Tax=Methylovirgula ligni TaxID=569860 RepID=A0A3D9YV14_9HYPH|nr:low molecular weight phosphatase family protein [Methylovirgula ligni]REF86420.1 protein-tyrosine-phosphatase [Methylovirgula ligni]